MHQFIVVSISTKWPSPQFSMCECFFGCLVQQTSRDVNLTSIGLVEMRTDPSWQEWSLLECWSCITSYFFPGSCCYPGHMQGRYQMQVLSKAQWSIWHIMLIFATHTSQCAAVSWNRGASKAQSTARPLGTPRQTILNAPRTTSGTQELTEEIGWLTTTSSVGSASWGSMSATPTRCVTETIVVRSRNLIFSAKKQAGLTLDASWCLIQGPR